ncbi:Zn-dependent protease [Paenibacillus cellulosilyticus]|uniref:Zn-dependent protease n=1 Tax=Paenibacillus cellulosilyticus TaxID=375489 RepID=A0A2V2YQ34_9BACL|nr:site-2 protease family protein [Paenibacillus cellulosilyticus]PWV98378.1 Zn-dependent protease [Paenibacillus cellulosilyticus]QKS43229.1 site-2 protease family protein [Paenibacillus cellulosilyticus]
MESLLWFPIGEFPFVVLTFIIAFTVHEFAHAYSAYKFGDMTAYNAGRVTLNPRVHLDVLGTILILLAGFGWAKPVPVNPNRFSKPRLMSIIVTAAGPISNLIMAFVGLLAFHLLFSTGVLDSSSVGVQKAFYTFLIVYFVPMNILLFLFNLIPLPPLDGYRIISNLLPLRVQMKLEQNIQWGMFFFLLLVFIPPLHDITIGPLFSLIDDIMLGLNDIIAPWFI